MAKFKYVARTISGESVDGTVDALNHRTALLELSSRGYYPVEVVQDENGNRSSLRGIFNRGALRPFQLAPMYRQLADLLSSGVTVPAALNTLKEQYQNTGLGKTIEELMAGLHDGHSLSAALERCSNSVPRLDINIIVAGEAGGNLEESLIRLADQKEEDHDIKQRIKSALAYPIVLLIASILVLIAFTLFVVPNLLALVENTGQQLPLATRVVIAVTGAMMDFGWIPSVLVAGALVLKRPRRLFDFISTLLARTSLRLPIVRDIAVKADTISFSRTLESLLRNGVSILSSWDIACSAVRNVQLQQSLRKMKDEIEQGKKLGPTLKHSPYVPRYVVAAVSVGEDSNNLENALSRIARTYESEMDRSIKLLTTVIEPAMILIVGGLVGGLIISLLLPIFQLDMGAM